MQLSPGSLHDLKHNLTHGQIDTLDAIWEYYMENEEWIPVRLLHHGFGKSKVVSEIERLGGSIVVQTSEQRKSCYILTFLGVLLTSDGEKVEHALVQYLDYVRQRFLDDPLIEDVSRGEVRESLGLSESSSQFLFHIIDIAHFWGGSSWHSQDDWRAGVPNDIDDLPEVSDLFSYVRKQALKGYDSNVPVRASDKMGYLVSEARKIKEQSEFWFLIDADLRQQMEADFKEARACSEIEAWKACTIMCASIIEGILLDFLRRSTAKAQEISRSKKLRCQGKDLDEWGLNDMVVVANELGIVGPESTHLLHALRGFRNLIHPGKLLRDHTGIGEKKARIALELVGVIQEELVELADTGSLNV